MRTFSGTHFSIGEQIGAYYTQKAVRFHEVTDAELLRQQIAFYEHHAPEIIDELRGLAAGGGYRFEQVANKILAAEILFYKKQPARSCSIGGCVDRTGQAWVARNYDWRPEVADHFQSWQFEYPDQSVVAVSDMDVMDESHIDPAKQVFFYHDAINAHGLFIGLTYAYCQTNEIGLCSADAVRLVSWRCKTVDEALDLFTNTPLGCPKNFFIADASGKMAVVHHAVTAFDIQYPDHDGILVLTNHYSEHLAKHDYVREANPNHSTFARQSRLGSDLKRLKGETVTFSALDGIMTNPETPVCQYMPDVHVETVWTLLMNQTEKDYQLIRKPRSPQRIVTNFKV